MSEIEVDEAEPVKDPWSKDPQEWAQALGRLLESVDGVPDEESLTGYFSQFKTALEAPRKRTDGYPIRQDMVDALARLLTGEQDAGMGLREMIEADECDEVEVETARGTGNGWEISWSGGTTAFVLYDGEIKPGDIVTWYPSAKLGARHYGWALNGELIEWATPWERLSRDIEVWAERDRRQREGLDTLIEEMDAAYEALPEPFKARIDRFRAEDPNFRLNGERYEMAAVGDAPKVAEALKPQIEALAISREDDEEAWLKAVADIFDEFRDQPFDKTKEMVPDLQEGHSGNTFGGAVGLGYRYACGLEV